MYLRTRWHWLLTIPLAVGLLATDASGQSTKQPKDNGNGNANGNGNGNGNGDVDPDNPDADGVGPPPKATTPIPAVEIKHKGPKPKIITAPPPAKVETRPTGPLPALLTPVTASVARGGAPSIGTASIMATAAVTTPKPLRMRFLVISADGNEPTFEGAQKFLDQIGIPYDTVVLTSTGGQLPPLFDATRGLYQAIILSTGNLATCNTSGACSIALPAAGWTALDSYTATYGVRTVAYYCFPDPVRYGITFAGSTTTSGSIGFSTATAATGTDTSAASVFSYMNRANPVTLTGAWTYLATPAPAAGEITTPLLTLSGRTVGAYHKKADGREYIALTMDSNFFLMHALAFNYGLFNWAAKGVFLGSRRYYVSPQMDDVFLPNDLYSTNPSSCRPSAFQADPTADPTEFCRTRRITGSDLRKIASWQDSTNTSKAAQLKISMPFNYFGTTKVPDGPAPLNDDLPSTATTYRTKFFWINHTYDHENLDCYNPVPNSGVCTPADYDQSDAEIWQNFDGADVLNLTVETQAMVTPNISGLNNRNFLQAAFDAGIRYLVGDATQAPFSTVRPNTGVFNTIKPQILMIPRRATNIFYNTDRSGLGADGSEPDEYNWFYAPGGLRPTFPGPLTYAQVVDNESNLMLQNLLKYEAYGVMFHQSNLWFYDGTNCLLTDVMNSLLTKFRALISTSLPVASLSEAQIGVLVKDRMAYNASGLDATLTPGLNISVKVTAAATVPVTGVASCTGRGANCTAYGGQNTFKVSATPTAPVVVTLP